MHRLYFIYLVFNYAFYIGPLAPNYVQINATRSTGSQLIWLDGLVFEAWSTFGADA